jgi:hypothetical protein
VVAVGVGFRWVAEEEQNREHRAGETAVAGRRQLPYIADSTVHSPHIHLGAVSML